MNNYYGNEIEQFGKNVKKNTLPVKQNIPATQSLQGEIVTPPPANYSAKAGIGVDPIDSVGRNPNQVSNPINQTQTQPLSLGNKVASSNPISGELITPTSTNYTQPKLIPNNSFIDGSVTNSPSLPNPKIQVSQPINTVNTANQSNLLSQQASSRMPPYTPANQQPIFDAPPPKIPVSNGTPVLGEATPTLPSKFGNVLGKVGAAMPAIQAGMNASNIMNQEANFAQNIHANSIADPNFGNELMGTVKPASHIGTLERDAALIQQKPVVAQQPSIQIPPNTIGTQAAVSPADTRNKITGAVESSSQMSPVSLPRKISPENMNTVTQPAMPTSMNDVTSGTGYIKGGNGAFKDGMGFVQNAHGVQLSNGKQIDPDMPTYHTADGRGTITSNARPSMDGLSRKLDTDVAARLQQQTANGAITAGRANQIQDQYTQDIAPIAQQPQMAMQRMAANGNIDAAKQLTGDAEQQSLGQYRKDTSANQKATQDAANEKEQYARNSPTQKLAEGTAQNSLDILSDDPNKSSEAYRKWKLTNPTKMEKVKNKVFDPTSGMPLGEQETLVNPYYPTSVSSSTSPVEGNKLPPPKKGEQMAGGLTKEQEAAIPPNTVITDPETGKTAYTKNEDGTWLNAKTGKSERPF
jgi:hypothetical protein